MAADFRLSTAFQSWDPSPDVLRAGAKRPCAHVRSACRLTQTTRLVDENVCCWVPAAKAIRRFWLQSCILVVCRSGRILEQVLGMSQGLIRESESETGRHASLSEHLSHRRLGSPAVDAHCSRRYQYWWCRPLPSRNDSVDTLKTSDVPI